MSDSALFKKILFFLLLNGVYFFSYFHRVAIPGTVFNEIQVDFNLTANQVAGLGTLVFYVYGVLQFFIGPGLDYFGTNRIFAAGGFLLGLGSVMFAFSTTIFSLYFSRVLVGFGASVAYLSVVKKTDELFGPRFFSLMLGFGIFLGYSGGLFATLPFERLVNIFGWRHTIAAISIVLLVIMLVILADFVKTKAFHHVRNNILLSDVKLTIFNKKAYPLILIAAINFSIYFLFQGIIGKKLIQDVCDITSKLAASFTFVMMILTMFFVLLSGIITHTVRKRKPIIVILSSGCLASCILMLANLALWKSALVFFISFTLLAFAGGSGPLIITVMKELSPSSGLGTAVGFINGICYLGVAATGNISGFIMDRFSEKVLITPRAIVYPVEAYQAVIVFCLLAAVVSFIVSFIIKETGKGIMEIPATF